MTDPALGGTSMSVQGTSEGTTPQTWAIIVWALYLASSITGISIIAGLIIAYIKRDELAATPFGSHMTYAIRTFWISLIGLLIGIVLTFVLIGILVLIAVCIWTLYRMIRGLVCAIDGRPIVDPQGWL
jgi:uncharacterized membrane protein